MSSYFKKYIFKNTIFSKFVNILKNEEIVVLNLNIYSKKILKCL